MLVAMRFRQRCLLVLLIVCACVSCDQTTKRIAAEHLPREHALSFAGDCVRLQVVENRGAFLGLGDELPAPVRELVLTGAVGVFLAVFLVFLLGSSKWSRPALVAGALLVGGGLGNLVDRILSGHVIDFLNCGIGPVRTGIFNVADMAIMLGLFVVVGSHMRHRAPTPVAAPDRGFP